MSIDYTVSLYEHRGKYYMHGLLFVQEITRMEYESYVEQSKLASSRFATGQENVKVVEMMTS